MALAGALAMSINLIGGFSNKTLRPLVAALLGEPYSQARCCYDLRRLKLKGLIVRLDSKIHDRLLRPLLAADRPPAPIEVRPGISHPRTRRG